MASNGISTLTYKRDRQVAKLNLAADDRNTFGRNRFFDLDQLPSAYTDADNDTANRTVNNSLTQGRPWALTSGVVTNSLVMSLDAANTVSGSTWSDISGNSNNATLVNSPTYTASDGGAVIFNGSSHYIRSPDLISAIGSPDTFSVGVWVYPTLGGNVMSVSSTNTVPFSSYHFSSIAILNSFGQPHPYFGVWNGSGITSVTGGAAGSYNTWYHLAITYNAATSTLAGYVNGASVGTQSVTYDSPSDAAASSHYLVFGAPDITNMGNGNYFPGRMGEIRVYSAALTSADVLNNYNETKSRYGL